MSLVIKQKVDSNPPLAADASTVVETGRRVLRMEADALVMLSENMPSAFVEVVELLLAADGRVILSGIGKSGHIARKIAATLSSTGTPISCMPARRATAISGQLPRRTFAFFCRTRVRRPS